MKKQKYVLNLLLILALTGFALWFALKDNFHQVLKCISQMNLLSLVIVLLWGVLFTAVWGLVYYVLGRKYTDHYTPGKGRQKRVPECFGSVVLFYEYRSGDVELL